jgi:mono/diheme cytochrome c family protein
MKPFVLPILIFAATLQALPAANTGNEAITFYKDVLPILQAHCQECHRPGEAGPMSFLSYAEARPWAKAIRGSVLQHTMPPWFANPAHGVFRNERRLTGKEIATLVSWADTGAASGDTKDSPAGRSFVEGWNIGQPDLVLSLPHAFEIPAQGTIEYQYVVIPTGFTGDRWVDMAEVRPGNRANNHHVIAFVRPPGVQWLTELKPGEFYVPPKRDSRRQSREEGTSEDGASAFGIELLVGYAPGLQPTVTPEGTAKLIPAGSDIVLQLHYTATGVAGSDLTRIGLKFAKEPPKFRQYTVNATNNRFVIPPNEPAYEVKSAMTLQEDTKLIWLMPHMHVRGKDFVYQAVYPTGEKEILLDVPRYDFNWQLGYVLKDLKVLPKGTRIECTAHFDNSVNNKANPNPNQEVRWGDQTWQEMMIGWFDVAIDPKMNPMDLYKPRKTAAKSTGDE